MTEKESSWKEASQLFRQIKERGDRRRAALKPLIMAELYSKFENPETVEEKIAAIESIPTIRNYLDNPYRHSCFRSQDGMKYLSDLEDEVQEHHFFGFMEGILNYDILGLSDEELGL
jgi:hypothetical protein